MNLPAVGVTLVGATWSKQAQYLAPGGHVKVELRWNEVAESGWPADLDAAWPELSKRPTIISVKLTPKAYRMQRRPRCSPPAPVFLQQWAQFLQATATRYHPTYFELAGNEPEVSAKDALKNGVDDFFGGFGFGKLSRENLVKVGGHYQQLTYPEYFGYMVSYAAGALRGTGVGIIAGALMASQDTGAEFWRAARKYARGYAAVSYHSYTLYDPTPNNGLLLPPEPRINVMAREMGGWSFRDWNLPGLKAAQLRATGETAPLILTETNLLKYDVPCIEYLAAQANYVDYCHSHMAEWDIDAMTIHSLYKGGWMNSWMVEGGGVKRPAWSRYAAWAQ